MWKGSETTYETNSETREKSMHMKLLNEKKRVQLTPRCIRGRIVTELPDLRSVASKWRRLVHAVFFSLIGHNLCLCHRDGCHDRSNGVWFDVEGYWGLVVFENKRLVRMRLCLFCWVSFCVERGKKFWFILFNRCSSK
jgi:hypothetical protein